MPCESLGQPGGSYIRRLFFCAGGERQWVGLRVVGSVLRVPSVIAVDDQFGFRPDQTQKPILVPFVEALQRPQEVIDGLQADSFVRAAWNDFDGRGSAESPVLAEGRASGFQSLFQRFGSVGVAAPGEVNRVARVFVTGAAR